MSRVSAIGPRRIPKVEPGLTLIELTVVIASLITFAFLLLVGARGWKRGSDRAQCIINIQNIQKGVRSFANLNGLNPGNNVAGLESQVVGPDAFFEALPVCPATGTYTLGGDQIPAYGTLYMTCSLGSVEDHIPPGHNDW